MGAGGDSGRYLSAKPLWDTLQIKYPRYSYKKLGIEIGFSPEAIRQWRDGKRRIKFVSGDKIAVSLGMHPAEIWGDEWWDIPDITKPDKGPTKKYKKKKKEVINDYQGYDVQRSA